MISVINVFSRLKLESHSLVDHSCEEISPACHLTYLSVSASLAGLVFLAVCSGTVILFRAPGWFIWEVFVCSKWVRHSQVLAEVACVTCFFTFRFAWALSLVLGLWWKIVN